MGKIINELGNEHGRLSVVGYSHAGEDKRIHWKCLCECGNEVVVNGTYLRNGDVQSCGCLQKDRVSEAVSTHGKSRDKIYITWLNMNARCYNTLREEYSRYGGRGIEVCDRWRKFKNFYDDMGDVEDGMTLERINNNGHYEPINCKWATRKEQGRNKGNNVWYTANDETMLLNDWADTMDINRTTIQRRLKKGQTMQEIYNHFMR